MSGTVTPAVILVVTLPAGSDPWRESARWSRYRAPLDLGAQNGMGLSTTRTSRLTPSQGGAAIVAIANDRTASPSACGRPVVGAPAGTRWLVRHHGPGARRARHQERCFA